MSRGARIVVAIVVAGLFVGGAIVWRVIDDGGVRRVPWHLTSPPVDRTVEVAATFGGSSCSHFDRWELVETEAVVTIEAHAWFSGADECTADLVYEEREVLLRQPLGGRRLVGCLPGDDDAACTTVTPGVPG